MSTKDLQHGLSDLCLLFFFLSDIVEMIEILLFQLLLRECLKTHSSDLICLPVLVNKLNLKPCHLGLSIINELSGWQAKCYL